MEEGQGLANAMLALNLDTANNQMCTCIQLCQDVSVSICDPDQAVRVIHPPATTEILVAWISETLSWNEKEDGIFEPCNLGHIYKFHQSIIQTLEGSNKQLVICVGEEPKHITLAALLLSGHMIMGHGMSVDDVASRFAPLSPLFVTFKDPSNPNAPELTLNDCWQAMHRANALGWTKMNQEEDEAGDFIDMDEYLHYDDSPNGAVHLVDPSRLLLFRRPHDLPNNRPWIDADGQRSFGPAHYAGVFQDFGVGLVVRCGSGASYDAAPLRAAGIAVEDLSCAVGGGELLRAVDRFLTLARVAPGLIAVQCGPAWGAAASDVSNFFDPTTNRIRKEEEEEEEEDDDEGGEDSDDDDDEGSEGNEGSGDGSVGAGDEDHLARLLVSAHLIRSAGFRAAPAVAWACIAHPARTLGPAPRLEILPQPLGLAELVGDVADGQE
jgi:hypothetical protein